MDLELILQITPFMAEAALLTLKVAALALVLGLAVGGVLAAARFSRLAPIRGLAAAYVSVIRGTPALVQLFVLYFGGPQIGLQLDPFTAGVISFGLNIGAYMSEGIRGAILSVGIGQSEAARTLGFGRVQTMRYFILPQAAPLMLRAIGVNTIILIKGTALISTIGVVDLTYSAQRFVTSTFKPFEVFAVAAVFYMVIIYGVGKMLDWLESGLLRQERISQ